MATNTFSCYFALAFLLNICLCFFLLTAKLPPLYCSCHEQELSWGYLWCSATRCCCYRGTNCCKFRNWWKKLLEQVLETCCRYLNTLFYSNLYLCLHTKCNMCMVHVYGPFMYPLILKRCHFTVHSFFKTVIILLYAGHVMGPPLRPDPTTPGYLMDLLAK